MLWQFDRGRIWQDLERWYDEELVQTERFDHGRFELQFGFGAEDDAEQGPLEIEAGGRAPSVPRHHRSPQLEDGPECVPRHGLQDRRPESRSRGRRAAGRARAPAPDLPRGRARFLDLPPERGRAEYYYISTKGGFERTAFDGSRPVGQGGPARAASGRASGRDRARRFSSRPRREAPRGLRQLQVLRLQGPLRRAGRCRPSARRRTRPRLPSPSCAEDAP